MRDSGTSRDQLWFIPYDYNDMSSLIIPSQLSFPLMGIDTSEDNILILDHSQTLWNFKNILSKDIKIKRVIDERVRDFKCWGDKVIIYVENNDLLQVSLDIEGKNN